MHAYYLYLQTRPRADSPCNTFLDNLNKLAFKMSYVFYSNPTRNDCKCFTCVTKTIANSAPYSRKPENYNGIIFFEFDIMKNSSSINF